MTGLRRPAVAAAFCLGLIAVLAAGCIGAQPAAPAAAPGRFVAVRDGRFTLDGQPHAFSGVNFWQAMNLGVTANRSRLLAELDHLQHLGVTNVRVMAASEGPNSEPQRTVPALMTAPGEYDPAVLDGLDFLLAELGKRNMQAVMVLNNFWHWSGQARPGDPWVGDPPHEEPGWYSVYDSDASTLAVIAAHAEELAGALE